jgi:hypothetical protein
MKDQHLMHFSFAAYRILYVGFIVLPILAGLDKYFDILTDWTKYLSPLVGNVIEAHRFMKVVGTIEILAGILVMFNPRIGAMVVAAWLWLIIINLLTIPGYFDVALRDFGLSLGALALASLSQAYLIPMKK